MKFHSLARFLPTLLAVAAWVAAPHSWAQSYPTRPVKLLVPYGTGGGSDVLARTIGARLQAMWGQGFSVENRAGASGNIGTEAVVRSPADGYTLLLQNSTMVVNPAVQGKLNYDPIKDFVPVIQVAKSPSMFVVPLGSTANSLKDFVALVKAQPGKFNYGTYGAGTSSHIQGALLNLQAGLDMVHVPFQGAAPLVNNMVGGQLTSAFIDSASARVHIKSFKPLAVTGTQRMPLLPDVPTFKELGYHSFDPYGWFGLFLPPATPPAIVNKLSEEVNRILRLPDVVARIEGLGLWVGGGKPEEFGQIVKSDAALYARIIKDANIQINQ